jgi:hypothetical protein
MLERGSCKNWIKADEVDFGVSTMEPAVMGSPESIHDINRVDWLALDICQIVLPLPIPLMELGHHSHHDNLDDYENLDAKRS